MMKGGNKIMYKKKKVKKVKIVDTNPKIVKEKVKYLTRK